MEPIGHPALPWPGLVPGHALVLPLQARFMATPFGPSCEIGGVRLQRKAEFHVTLLNRAMARAAGEALGEAGLRALYESLAWLPRRTGRYTLLRAPPSAGAGLPVRWSLIEHLDLGAMHRFRDELARLLGPAFADPVPHVTHFVQGDPNGIGVSDTRALATLRVCDLPP